MEDDSGLRDDRESEENEDETEDLRRTILVKQRWLNEEDVGRGWMGGGRQGISSWGMTLADDDEGVKICVSAKDHKLGLTRGRETRTGCSLFEFSYCNGREVSTIGCAGRMGSGN